MHDPPHESSHKSQNWYTLDGFKTNHVFHGQLKVVCKDENEIDSLVSTINFISKDTGMQFGI